MMANASDKISRESTRSDRHFSTSGFQNQKGIVTCDSAICRLRYNRECPCLHRHDDTTSRRRTCLFTSTTGKCHIYSHSSPLTVTFCRHTLTKVLRLPLILFSFFTNIHTISHLLREAVYITTLNNTHINQHRVCHLLPPESLLTKISASTFLPTPSGHSVLYT